MVSASVPTSHKYLVIDVEAPLRDHENGARFEINFPLNSHARLVQNKNLIIFSSDQYQALAFLVFDIFENLAHAGDEIFVVKPIAILDSRADQEAHVLVYERELLRLVLQG